jgi:hypothetical protein
MALLAVLFGSTQPLLLLTRVREHLEWRSLGRRFERESDRRAQRVASPTCLSSVALHVPAADVPRTSPPDSRPDM